MTKAEYNAVQRSSTHYDVYASDIIQYHKSKTRHRASTSMYSLTFHVRVMLPEQRNRAPIANPPNSAQLGGIPCHSPKLHLGSCNSVGMWPRTDRQTQTHTHTQTRTTKIHFVSFTTHAKCNDFEHVILIIF